MAQEFGFAHTTRWVRRDEFAAEREALLAAMDQPSIDGVNTYFVSKAARKLPDAILSRPQTCFSIPVQSWLAGEEANLGRGYRGWAGLIYRRFAPVNGAPTRLIRFRRKL
jgi:hypothetical protein